MEHNKVSGRKLLEYQPLLLNYARRFTQDRAFAEDLVQETFLAYWKHTGRHPNPDSDNEIRNFLKTVLKHIFFGEYNKRRRQDAYRMQHLKEKAARTTSTHHSVAYQTGEIKQMIRELLPWSKRIVFLLHLAGYQLNEIAQIVGIPLGTVQSRIFYTKRFLRKQYQSR